MSNKTVHTSPAGTVESHYTLVTQDHGAFPLNASMDTSYPYALIKDRHVDGVGMSYETAELRTVHHDEWTENPLDWDSNITLVETRHSRSLPTQPEDHYSYELAGVIEALDEAAALHIYGRKEHDIYGEVKAIGSYYDIEVEMLWGLIKKTGFDHDRRAEVIQNYLDGRGGNLTYREFSFPGAAQGDWVEGYAVTEVTSDPAKYVDSTVALWDSWRTGDMHRIEISTYERLAGQTDWTLVDGPDTVMTGVTSDNIEEALASDH